ncbi:MAG TPA: hypothetical protein PKM48_07395 [Parvularculaceae bacterium]|nr:hypothetical protein [Parvularculaceae bacterium]
MKKFSIATITALATVFAAGQASATLIDFAAEATGNERGVADGTILNTAALGGMNLSFRAGIGGAARDFAYFNDGAGQAGVPTGLGTCTNLDMAAQCNPAYDDVVAANEWVQIGFEDGPFDVFRVSFAFPADVSAAGLIKITTTLNGVVQIAILSLAQAANTKFGLVDTIRFEFVDSEFVVASISDVPVPGALPLLLSGLAGLGFAARRKKA